MLVELIRKHTEVNTPTGEKKTYTNYYVKTENGNYIAIKPAFPNDYKALYVLAKEQKNEETK